MHARPVTRRPCPRPWWPLLLGLAVAVFAGGEGRRSYELPPGDAAIMLREVSAISGCEILFAAAAVRGVRTNAVRGDFTPVEAATRLLAGTVLSVVRDEKTGALAVRRGKRVAENPPRPAAEK